MEQGYWQAIPEPSKPDGSSDQGKHGAESCLEVQLVRHDNCLDPGAGIRGSKDDSQVSVRRGAGSRAHLSNMAQCGGQCLGPQKPVESKYPSAKGPLMGLFEGVTDRKSNSKCPEP